MKNTKTSREISSEKMRLSDEKTEYVKVCNLPAQEVSELCKQEKVFFEALATDDSRKTADLPSKDRIPNLFDELTGNTTLSNNYASVALEPPKEAAEIAKETESSLIPAAHVTSKKNLASVKRTVSHDIPESPLTSIKPKSKGIFKKWKLPNLRLGKKRDAESSTKKRVCRSKRDREISLSRGEEEKELEQGSKAMVVSSPQRPEPTPPIWEVRSAASFEPSKLTTDSTRWGLAEIQNDLELLNHAVEQEKIEKKDRVYIDKAREYRAEARTLLLKADDILKTDGQEAEHLIRNANSYATQAQHLLSKVKKARERRHQTELSKCLGGETTSNATSMSNDLGFDRCDSSGSLDSWFTVRVHQEDLARRLGEISLFSAEDMEIYWPSNQCSGGNQGTPAAVRDSLAAETDQILNAMSEEEAMASNGSRETLLGLRSNRKTVLPQASEGTKSENRQHQKSGQPDKRRRGVEGMEGSSPDIFPDELDALLGGAYKYEARYNAKLYIYGALCIEKVYEYGDYCNAACLEVAGKNTASQPVPNLIVCQGGPWEAGNDNEQDAKDDLTLPTCLEVYNETGCNHEETEYDTNEDVNDDIVLPNVSLITIPTFLEQDNELGYNREITKDDANQETKDNPTLPTSLEAYDGIGFNQGESGNDANQNTEDDPSLPTSLEPTLLTYLEAYNGNACNQGEPENDANQNTEDDPSLPTSLEPTLLTYLEAYNGNACSQGVMGNGTNQDTKNVDIILPALLGPDKETRCIIPDASYAPNFVSSPQVQQARDDDDDKNADDQYETTRTAVLEDISISPSAANGTIETGYAGDRSFRGSTTNRELFPTLSADKKGHGSTPPQTSSATVSVASADYTAPPLHLVGSDTIAEFFVATEKALGLDGSVTHSQCDTSTSSAKLRPWSFNFMSK